MNWRVTWPVCLRVNPTCDPNKFFFFLILLGKKKKKRDNIGLIVSCEFIEIWIIETFSNE